MTHYLKVMGANKQAFFDQKLRQCWQTKRIVKQPEISWHAQENSSFQLQCN